LASPCAASKPLPHLGAAPRSAKAILIPRMAIDLEFVQRLHATTRGAPGTPALRLVLCWM
jgi:hypothetical protein